MLCRYYGVDLELGLVEKFRMHRLRLGLGQISHHLIAKKKQNNQSNEKIAFFVD